MCKESDDEPMVFHMVIEVDSIFYDDYHDPIVTIDRAINSPQSVQ